MGSILASPEPSLARHRSAEGLARAALGTVTPTDSTVLDALATMQPPLLLVVGENDAGWIRDSVQEAAELVPGARIVVVPDAGHAVNLERPDVLNRLVADHATAAGAGRRA